MLPYHNDDTLKIEYDPVNNKFGFAENVIGPQAWVTIAVTTLTPSDTNGIWVTKAGNDLNAGTQAAPKLTLLAAGNACTAAKMYVWVDDSGQYAEELDTIDNDYFSGIYATTGNTPVYTLRVLGYTPTDGNSIFFDKTGDDLNAGTQAAPKLTI